MIVFDLKCSRAHVFEGWFDSGADFESQQARGLVECPLCGCQQVVKAVMAPAVPAKGNRGTGGNRGKGDNGSNSQPSDADRKQQLERLAAYQAEVEQQCDYVGTSFAAEARARHDRRDDEPNLRGIIGEASVAEAMELASEGIAVTPLPFRSRQKADA